MKAVHPLLSGVLATVIFAVASAPLIVSAASSYPIASGSATTSSSPPSTRSGSTASSGAIVVESRESSVTYQPPIEDAPVRSAVEDQYQMQLLQQEVMQLRGLVEQLQHELQKQKSVQDDRYLELDARLQQALKAQVVEVQPQEPNSAVPVPVVDDNLSEKELYETTQLLIRNRQYEMSITQLEALISRFPNGEYTPNAYYWLGQVNAAKTNPDFEQARQALAQVISYFPDHNKVPDAAYALGKVYHTLGDCTRATELLQQVVDQYPGKSAAKLAENYLRESVNCDS
jgi:tol-pal system protein YbgF